MKTRFRMAITVLGVAALASTAVAEPQLQTSKDEQGRTVSATTPVASSTFEYDVDGKISARTHQRGSNEWLELTRYDEDGFAYLRSAGVEPSRLAEIARILGVAEARAASPKSRQDIDSERNALSIEAPYAEMTGYYPLEGKTTLPNGLLRREESVSLGHSMATWERRDKKGFRIEDDRGGLRWMTFHDGDISRVEDRHGEVVRIETTKEGYPQKLILAGGKLELEYTYSDTMDWTQKTLRGGSGKVLGQWDRIDARSGDPDAMTPRTRAQAFMGFHGLIAEWDDQHTPEGVAVIGHGNDPYALIGLDDGEVLYRSVTAGGHGRVMNAAERIDYNEDEIIIVIELGRAALNANVSTVLVKVNR